MDKVHEDIVRTVELANVLVARETNFRLRIADPDCFVVIARDPKRQTILVGGYGALGVGRMWVPDGPGAKKYAGYDTAPEVCEGARDDLAESFLMEQAALAFLHGTRQHIYPL